MMQDSSGTVVSVVVSIRARIMFVGRSKADQRARIAEQDVRERELVRTSELVSDSFKPA
jgi:hypothetical protein